MLLLLSLTAHADLAPPNMRGLRYTLTIDNLAEYPEHVLLIYPTSNNGYAYVVEPDKGLTGLMHSEGSRHGPTALYAMTRADFEARYPEPFVYDHGDDGAMVMVVPLPQPNDLRAELNIAPPDLVPTHDPRIGLVRTVHIATLDESYFELALVSEEPIYADQEPVSAEQEPISTEPIPGVVPPKQTRCGTVAGAGGLIALSMALLGITRRRYPTSSSSQ
ncbi:MAG: hypothetical protein ACI8RZ_002427 [Myxococcota bacterium]|jgi:hypothetical protein